MTGWITKDFKAFSVLAAENANLMVIPTMQSDV